ncbi:MAG: hypothetical protein C0424_09335 [Sphingobacteriaceae bacterium]|nr:hypothetical protein [Sphingobacteriaceae bacterium]
MQNKPLIFLLSIQTLAVLVYTFVAVSNEGIDLLSYFLGNVKALGWSGQFNLDFGCYLLLSGLWVLWRHQFSAIGWLLAPVVAVLGIVAFAPYLIYLLWQCRGDLPKVLLGERG